MRYNLSVDYDGSGYKQAFPDNVSPLELVGPLDSLTEMSQNFHTVKFGTIQFSNKPYLYANTLNPVYKLFDIINDSSFTQKILVKLETNNIDLVGYFGKNDCTFDVDKKILTVTPTVISVNSTILESMETDVDFNNYGFQENNIDITIENLSLKTIQDWPVVAPLYGNNQLLRYVKTYPRNVVKESSYQNAGGIGLYFDLDGSPKESLFEDSYWKFETRHTTYPDVPGNRIYGDFDLKKRIEILGQQGSPSLDMHDGDYELSRFRVYEGTRTGGLTGNRWRQLYCQTWFSRDEIYKVDVVDTENEYGFEPPIGKGWHMRKSVFKDGKPGHWWTRKPFNGFYSENWQLQPDVLNEKPDLSGFYKAEYDWNWYRYRETRLVYDDTSLSVNISTSIDLRSFFEYLIQNSNQELASMQFKSTFLFNDLEEQIKILNGKSGYNYVTGRKNYLNSLRVFFTRDIVSVNESEIKQIPKYNIKDILTDFNKLFANSLIWFVDSDGYFRMEHKFFTDLTKSFLDISGSSLLQFTSKFEYDKSKMYEKITFDQINSGYPDFTRNLIKYPKIVSNNRNQDLIFENETRHLSTDVKFCILNPDSLSDGIVLIVVDENNRVPGDICQISGQKETNGKLALSNLLTEFGTYEGVWTDGSINGVDQKFKVSQRNKIGIEIVQQGTKLSSFYLTQLGIGILDSGTIDLDHELTKIKLRYRHDSSYELNTDTFTLKYSDNVMADIGNYSTTGKLTPQITTDSYDLVTNDSVIIDATLHANGDDAVMEMGVCYSMNPTNVSILNTKVQAVVALGIFNCELQSLISDTTYYARAYAISNAGVGYGEIITFKTLIN